MYLDQNPPACADRVWVYPRVREAMEEANEEIRSRYGVTRKHSGLQRPRASRCSLISRFS